MATHFVRIDAASATPNAKLHVSISILEGTAVIGTHELDVDSRADLLRRAREFCEIDVAAQAAAALAANVVGKTFPL